MRLDGPFGDSSEGRSQGVLWGCGEGARHEESQGRKPSGGGFPRAVPAGYGGPRGDGGFEA